MRVMERRRVDDELPLTPAEFETMLALFECELHGYAIMLKVAERTDGRQRLLPGTLYRALSRMTERGLVAAAAERPDPELDDERRRYYALTDFGRSVLQAEARRLADQVDAARANKLLPSTRRG